MSHVLEDEDVLQIYKSKTKGQIKKEKQKENEDGGKKEPTKKKKK